MTKKEKKSQLDGYSMMIVSKYLNTCEDFKQMVMVSKKNEELFDKFHFNPFPLTPQNKRYFTKLETQYLYSPKDQEDSSFTMFTYSYPVATKDMKPSTDTITRKYLSLIETRADQMTIVDDEIQSNGLKISQIQCKLETITKLHKLTTVTSFGKETLSRNSNLTHITFCNCVREIGERLFEGCYSLTSVNFGYAACTIKRQTFSNCSNLKKLILSPYNSVDEASGIETFRTDISCNGPVMYGKIPLSIAEKLRKKGVESERVYISKQDIYNMHRLPNRNVALPDIHITIPATVDVLHDGCFNCFYQLTSISIPTTIKELGDCCFHRCHKLSEITLPSTISSLGWMCFGYCTSLSEILLPSAIKELPERCFIGCTQLKSIHCRKNIIVNDKALFNCPATLIPLK